MNLTKRKDVLPADLDEQVKGKHQQGMTAQLIARTIGVDHKTIVRSLLNQNLIVKERAKDSFKQKHSAETLERAVQLYREGYTASSIGKTLGLPQSTVHAAVDRLAPELKQKDAPWTDEAAAKVTELYRDKKWKAIVIAATLNLSLNKVQELCKSVRKKDAHAFRAVGASQRYTKPTVEVDDGIRAKARDLYHDNYWSMSAVAQELGITVKQVREAIKGSSQVSLEVHHGN